MQNIITKEIMNKRRLETIVSDSAVPFEPLVSKIKNKTRPKKDKIDIKNKQ